MIKLKHIFFIICMFCSVMINAQEKTIAEITFEGNKKTKESFLKRLIKTKKGEAFNTQKIVLDIDRLERLDGIAHASYTTADEGGRFTVNFKIEENFSIIPGLNIGQANDDSFAFRVSLFEFNGLGQNIIFGGFIQQQVFTSYALFLEHPYLLSNKLGLGANFQDLTTQQPIYFPDQQVNYTHRRVGPEFTLFYEKDFNNQFEFSTKIFKEEYRLIEGDEQNIGVVDPIEPESNALLLTGVYNHVDIDTEYHQFKGFQNNLNLQYFNKENNEFLQTEYILTNTTSYFKRIGSRGNWASRLQLTLSNDLDESYFAPVIIDNQQNVRGVGNTSSRGTASFAINSEYRHTLIEKNWFVLQSNTFIDVAGLRGPDQNFGGLFEANKFEVFPGVGIRLIHKKIFNAVLRLDYGFKVNGSSNAENGALVFGIGQYF